MCGIVGYVGNRPCRDLLIAGLEKLEYRGYDSAGLSLVSDGEISSVRAVGNLSNLRAAVEAQDEADRRGPDNGGVAVAEAPATIGVAHTRWATHGRPTEENAHPHCDCSGKIHIVLNGSSRTMRSFVISSARRVTTSARRPTPRSSPT